MKAVAVSPAPASPCGNAWESAGARESAMPLDEGADEHVARPEAARPLSFDAIYDQHVDFVWRALRGLGVAPPFLDDAVQDVFIVVHRRLPEFLGRSKVTTWLFSIALRVAQAYRSRQRPTDNLADVEDRLLDERPSPFDAAARAEILALLERILDSLDDKKRIVFVLMELEQMTAEEVAALLDVNVNTIYSRHRMARIEFDRLVALHARGAR
jgi:RNA polymerase sigma-70 factor, ECF subfamily